jgi:hypothetical protein
MTTVTHDRLRADALRQWQAHFDEQIFRKIGMRAPEPKADQTILDYRRETDRMLKMMCLPQNHELYKIQWRRLEPDALTPFEPQLFAACEKEFNNPNNVPEGQIRMTPRMDAYGKITHYDAIGRESFVKDMMRPGRRVVSWRTDQGYLYPNGHAMAVQQVRP